MFVGFRTSTKKDKDIEKDLARFGNASERIRELYRLGLAVERGEYVKASSLGAAVMVREELPKRVTIPREPTVKPLVQAPATPMSDIEKNMLDGF